MQIGDYVMRKIDLVFWQFKSRSKHPSSVQSSDYEIIYFRQKNKEQRENVIGELVTTEREYCRDLKLTWQAFSLDDPDVLEQKQIDVKGRDFEKEKISKIKTKDYVLIYSYENTRHTWNTDFNIVCQNLIGLYS